MESNKKQNIHQYDDGMLDKFKVAKFASVKKVANEWFDNQIQVTKSYLFKFIKYYVARADPKHKRRYEFSISDICDDVLEQLPRSMDRFEFYEYMADYFITKSSVHLLYWNIASMISTHKLHKKTNPSIKFVADALYNNKDVHGEQSPLISEELYNIIMKHHRKIQNRIVMSRDYEFDFFGLKTLERSYLLKVHDHDAGISNIVERPQHLIMRLAIGIHGHDLDSAFETYEWVSRRYFTHATPTLFNAGTIRPQMSSCYLSGMGDSIESIFETIADLAYISKWAGGIGLHLSGIRAKGSLIRKTNGKSDGIIPLCIVLNWVAKYINQGGKRNGSFAIYLEPWHADIFEFVELRSNKGSESTKARDLYLALWIPDLFMERLAEGGIWSLMCPDECPGLNTCHGEEFKKLYEKYEKEGKFRKQVKAIDLWKHIMTSHIETGFPYVLYKDHANRKSNQKNLGTIRSSNLCSEIIEYSDENETAVCNLSSICLPRFVDEAEDGGKSFNYELLMKITKMCVKNLNKVIDKNYYPTPKTKKSNMKHRPIGIGVQGLADLYNMMGLPFESEEADILNRKVFETIYYAAMEESINLAKKDGKPYESFEGSPLSEGIFQFDMWDTKEEDLLMGFDWDSLRKQVIKHGAKNSLLIALMPTASTSQIMGNSECVEPYMSNIFVRSTLAGDFIVVNRNLMSDLEDLGLWTDDVRKKLIIYNGSVQNIDEVPDRLKKIYKTAFEQNLSSVVIQSAHRGRFVCQSQSLNLFIDDPNFDILNTALYNGWKMGLKTGMYYYRTVPAVNPISFGIDVEDIVRLTNNKDVLNLILGHIGEDEDDEIDGPDDLDSDSSMKNDTEFIMKSIEQFTRGFDKPRKQMGPDECLACGS
jgi:ribonucleoside-diphosphate reductase alpha chain